MSKIDVGYLCWCEIRQENQVDSMFTYSFSSPTLISLKKPQKTWQLFKWFISQLFYLYRKFVHLHL